MTDYIYAVNNIRNNTNVNTVIDDTLIMKYAPNVVEGVEKLSNWAKKFLGNR